MAGVYMDLNEVAVFVKVVELGSFTQAAIQLEMPNSTVSAKVSSLEARLGMTLIKRTTRKLFVTDEGRSFYQRCLKGLQEITTAEEEIAGSKGEPRGLLRITAPIELGSFVLPLVISEFRKHYPKVHLDIDLSDHSVDLVADGIDLAIRAGELKDSSLVAKKLGSSYFAPFASPQYLKQEGNPRHPKDLKDHCCLQFTRPATEEWKLTSPKGIVTVPMSKQVVINDLSLLKSLTMAGQGISLLPTFYGYADVKSKKLVRVLPEWKTNITPIHFVYPGQKFLPAKVSSFITIAADIIKDSLKECEL